MVIPWNELQKNYEMPNKTERFVFQNFHLREKKTVLVKVSGRFFSVGPRPEATS